MDKIKDYDKYVSYPNFEAAKKGQDCETVTENKALDTFGGKKAISKKTVFLKASNNKYVCADESLGDLVYANKDIPSLWETFTLVTFNNNECALISFKDKFLTTDIQQGDKIIADRAVLGGWEVFTFEERADKAIVLKGVNGKYLSVDPNTLQLSAKSESPGTMETFTLIIKE